MAFSPQIFKSYDIRGIYPQELDEQSAYQIGRALVDYVQVETILIGRDMRLSSGKLSNALAKGICEQGSNALDAGEVSTDTLCWASGNQELVGVMVTASHLGADFNGFKIYNSAKPISMGSGLEEIRDKVLAGSFNSSSQKGKVEQVDILTDFAGFALSLVDKDIFKGKKIVVDAGNGMAGKLIPLVFKNTEIDLIPLYFELEGSFPNHPANPEDYNNLADLQEKVVAEKADLGMAFDGDGDRVFFIDETGEIIGSSLVIALIARQVLEKETGRPIVFDLTCSRIVEEVIREHQGLPVREKVGHSHIKRSMRNHQAIFGGESSGHYYFQKNYYADSGLIAGLMILELVSRQDKSLAEIVRQLNKKYFIEQVKFEAAKGGEIIKNLEKHFQDGKISHLDGLTVEYPDWWFNLRTSNTEPILKLTIEAKSKELKQKKIALLKSLIQGQG